MDFTFPTGRARFVCLHNVLGPCELLTWNVPENKGISARVFPKDIQHGAWYKPASEGATSEDVLQWLEDNDMSTQLMSVTGTFHIMEYTQFILLSNKHTYDGEMNQFEIQIKWPIYDTTFTKSFKLSTMWWMTALSVLFPGCQLHRDEVAYHEWLKARNESRVEKARKAIQEAQALRLS